MRQLAQKVLHLEGMVEAWEEALTPPGKERLPMPDGGAFSIPPRLDVPQQMPAESSLQMPPYMTPEPQRAPPMTPEVQRLEQARDPAQSSGYTLRAKVASDPGQMRPSEVHLVHTPAPHTPAPHTQPRVWSLHRLDSSMRGAETGSVHSAPGDVEGVSLAGVRAVSSIPRLLHPILGEAVKRHSPPNFSGEPADFPSWKRDWERFLETVNAVSGGGIGQSAMLLLLEGYLDGASKKMLRATQKENPDITCEEFFLQLSREMMPGPVEAEKNRWKRTRLVVKGGHLNMSDWREFKASLQESIYGHNPPQDELRDHVVKQLPSTVREHILREEVNSSRNKFGVNIRRPRNVPLEVVLEVVGQELGLRLSNLQTDPDIIAVDCLTGEIQKKALGLDGMQISDDLGRVAGTLSIWAAANTPLPLSDIMKLVDSLCWVDREMERLGPKETTQFESRPTYAQVVQTKPPPPRQSPPRYITPRKSPPRRESPPVSPQGTGKGGKGWNKGGGKGGSQASGRGDGKGGVPRPANWCYTCERAGYNSLHDHKTCRWAQEERKWQPYQGGQNTPPRSTTPQRSNTPSQVRQESPKPFPAHLCLECHILGRPFDHDFFTCDISRQARQSRKWKGKDKGGRQNLPQNNQGPQIPRDPTPPKSKPQGDKNPNPARGQAQ